MMSSFGSRGIYSLRDGISRHQQMKRKLGGAQQETRSFTRLTQRRLNYESEFKIGLTQPDSKETELQGSMLAYTERMQSLMKARGAGIHQNEDERSKQWSSSEKPLLIRATHIPNKSKHLPKLAKLKKNQLSNSSENLSSTFGKEILHKNQLPLSKSLDSSLAQIKRGSTALNREKLTMNYVSASDLHDFVDYSLLSKGSRRESQEMMSLDKNIKDIEDHNRKIYSETNVKASTNNSKPFSAVSESEQTKETMDIKGANIGEKKYNAGEHYYFSTPDTSKHQVNSGLNGMTLPDHVVPENHWSIEERRNQAELMLLEGAKSMFELPILKRTPKQQALRKISRAIRPKDSSPGGVFTLVHADFAHLLKPHRNRRSKRNEIKYKRTSLDAIPENDTVSHSSGTSSPIPSRLSTESYSPSASPRSHHSHKPSLSAIPESSNLAADTKGYKYGKPSDVREDNNTSGGMEWVDISSDIPRRVERINVNIKIFNPEKPDEKSVSSEERLQTHDQRVDTLSANLLSKKIKLTSLSTKKRSKPRRIRFLKADD